MNCPYCSSEIAENTTVCPICGGMIQTFLFELTNGTTLNNGRYNILGKLGQGGFGISYLALDRSADKKIVIKEFFLSGSARNGRNVIAPPQFTRAEFDDALNKFMEEGNILSKINHENVVKAFETFRENSTAYIAMEYAEGTTLDKFINEIKYIPEHEVRKVLDQLCNALNAIHAANFLHRDLKPENIIINKSNYIKVIDFGTSRNYISSHTSSMTRILTPGYAAPEQYVQNARFGPPLDIYSLGAILYKMLTSEAPPPSIDRVMDQNIRIDIRSKRRDISSELEHVILKCMMIDANKRYQTCYELVRDLQTIQNVKPVQQQQVVQTVFTLSNEDSPKAYLENANYYLKANQLDNAKSFYNKAYELDRRTFKRYAQKMMGVKPELDRVFRKHEKVVEEAFERTFGWGRMFRKKKPQLPSSQNPNTWFDINELFNQINSFTGQITNYTSADTFEMTQDVQIFITDMNRVLKSMLSDLQHRIVKKTGVNIEFINDIELNDQTNFLISQLPMILNSKQPYNDQDPGDPLYELKKMFKIGIRSIFEKDTPSSRVRNMVYDYYNKTYYKILAYVNTIINNVYRNKY